MFFAGRFLLAIGVTLLLVKLLPGFLLLPLLLAMLFFGFFGRRGPWRGYGRGQAFHYGYGHGRCGGAPRAPRDEVAGDEAPRANTGETTRL
jgi:hypothetical protein